MAKVIEGEAPETDEEDLEDDKNDQKEKTFGFKKPKKMIHVDEKVQQHWKHLATNLQTVIWRRSQSAVKMVQEQKDLAHDTFSTIQAATHSLRAATSNLLKIEDGLADIREAAALLPDKYENTVETLKIS